MPAHTPFKVSTVTRGARSFTIIVEGDTVSVGENAIIRVRRKCADHASALADAATYESDERLLPMLIAPRVEKAPKKGAPSPDAAPSAAPSATVPAAKTGKR